MGLGGLEGVAKREALDDILYTLNLNVGRRMIDQMTDEQQDEFERLSRPGADVEKLMYWIALNVPNHADLIEEEATKMRDEADSFADAGMAALKSEPADNSVAPEAVSNQTPPEETL
jgi:hypothetical protein